MTGGFFMRHLLWLYLMYPFAAGAQVTHCHCDAPIVSDLRSLKASVKGREGAQFVPLQQLIPGIVADIRYATTNNFTHRVLYTDHVLLLRAAPANALKKVQAELATKGLGLKVYDAYRPFSVTCSLWRHTTDRRYTANPRKGSHHNRGIAVDITLVDLKTGKELDMGTGYDSFTDTAHHSFAYLPQRVLDNRRLLKGLMWKHGFNFVPTEWWHYHWRDKSYEVADVPFSAFR